MSVLERLAALAAALLVAACAAPPPPAAIAPSAASAFAVIPPDKDGDLKLYHADGRIETGARALERMQREAGVILWLAGNQFFAMDDVVRGFQAANPGTSVGLVTLPPGLLVEAIEKGGWRYAGKDHAGRPDVYASVNLGHLGSLRKAGLMSRYATYMRNEMVLLVARGNPKRIEGIADLARPGVRSSLPNPVNEGIMQFYGRKVLERHGLWTVLSGGKECVSCEPVPGHWFTAVHHRETPDRILAGRSDTGIVWLTEALEAQRDGKAVDVVRLPPQDSLRDEVAYAIGVLDASPRRSAAERYVAFVGSPAGQEAYARHGFVKASAEDLAMRAIP